VYQVNYIYYLIIKYKQSILTSILLEKMNSLLKYESKKAET
jgi:hypothetical protein